MKKLGILALLLVGCLFLNGYIPAVRTADVKEDKTAAENLAKAARFENMLNINTVYGDAFYDNQLLVNSATAFLKNYADEDGFIRQEIVSSYIKDMYDIDIDINEKINEGLPQKEGFVLLIPRGYSEYRHTVTNIETVDGYIRVTTSVLVTTHDNGSHTVTGETYFIENANSPFGYSIISSVLSEKTDAIRI